ncbi:hypothetical protein HGRIS_012703 [Hohenbuehelia grisea]|uniref:Fungal N-terminal domain-containing protein n=1 Tax=Hohenbuehelia grisea TaxID=104357 RepID=A0ABR3IT34_9AGAR
MDPLSISAAVVAFVDIARRIKGSIDKVAHNRRSLKELSEDVLKGLTGLEKFCRTRNNLERALDGSEEVEAELSESLEDLQSQLAHVLATCERTFPKTKPSGPLSAARSSFKAWRKVEEIEADIRRLKDQVQSCHMRFTSLASARIEHSLLVLRTDQRARLHQMEGLVARVLIDSRVNNFRAATVLESPARDGIEYQYLHLQISNIVESLGRLAALKTFAQEEPEGVYLLPLDLSTILPCLDSEPIQIRRTVIQALQILQLIELSPNALTIQTGALSLKELSLQLWNLGLLADAAAVQSWAVNFYRTLVKGKEGRYFVPYLGWSLNNLACYHAGQLAGLEASEAAVSTYRTLIETTPDHNYTSLLPPALSIYASELMNQSRYEDSLAQAQEALSLQRKSSEHHTCSCWSWVEWDASGEEAIVFSSGRRFGKCEAMAYEEALILQQLACSLAAMNRMSEARLVNTEALSVLNSLAGHSPRTYDRYLHMGKANHATWSVVLYDAPTSCTAVSVQSSDEEDS